MNKAETLRYNELFTVNALFGGEVGWIIAVLLSASALLAFPRHYPALKTLEHLEHTYLPQVSHYRFCKIMVDNIPKLREEIKEVSMSDLKDFLESIRKHSDKIGETAMKQVGLVCTHVLEAFGGEEGGSQSTVY